jgi:SAM-dependent methyltransferase
MAKLKNLKIYFHMMFSYKPKKFWNELLSSSFDLRGVGHFRLSNEENLKMYEVKKRIISSVMDAHRLKITGETNIIEIGCGVGYWTEFLKSLGAKKYTGNDIADVSVKNLRQIYPEYDFIHGDISEISLSESSYDLAFMIDVTQHIIDDDRFNKALKNVWASLRHGAYFLVTVWDPSKNVYLANKLRINRIEKPRAVKWYKNIIRDEGSILAQVDFNDKYLLLIKKN